MQSAYLGKSNHLIYLLLPLPLALPSLPSPLLGTKSAYCQKPMQLDLRLEFSNIAHDRELTHRGSLYHLLLNRIVDFA